MVWVFFRAPNFEIATQVFTKLFVWSVGVQQIYMWFIFAIIVEVVYLVWCKYKSTHVEAADSKFKMNAFYILWDLNSFYGLTAFFFLIMMTLGLAYTNASPFIYFQF